MTGTARYMAPECYDGADDSKAYTNKVDCFSFAILAHEMLARKRAYSDTDLTMDQVARAVHNKGYRPKVPKTWSSEVTSFLERAWAQEPAKRPGFTELAAELLELARRAEGADGGAAALFGLAEPATGAMGSGCCVVM